MDLSYPGGRHHAAGTATQAQHFIETSRYYTFEMKEWEWYLLHRKSLLQVPAVGGGEVWTSDVFLSYLREFEKLFTESSQKVIDATEGGALKDGTEVWTLKDAIGAFARRELPEDLRGLLDPGWGSDVWESDRYEAALEVLARRIEEANELGALYKKSSRLLEKVVQITEGGVPADDVVQEVLRVKDSFTRFGFLYHLLTSLAQSDLFLRMQRDRGIEGEELSGVEKQHRQAVRDLDYVRGLRNALEFVADGLRNARRSLQARLKETASG
jgi:hypothetical protein